MRSKHLPPFFLPSRLSERYREGETELANKTPPLAHNKMHWMKAQPSGHPLEGFIWAVPYLCEMPGPGGGRCRKALWIGQKGADTSILHVHFSSDCEHVHSAVECPTHNVKHCASCTKAGLKPLAEAAGNLSMSPLGYVTLNSAQNAARSIGANPSSHEVLREVIAAAGTSTETLRQARLYGNLGYCGIKSDVPNLMSSIRAAEKPVNTTAMPQELKEPGVAQELRDAWLLTDLFNKLQYPGGLGKDVGVIGPIQDIRVQPFLLVRLFGWKRALLAAEILGLPRHLFFGLFVDATGNMLLIGAPNHIMCVVLF